MTVFDASALLAFLHGENGGDEVERSVRQGGVCGAANWSELAQKIAQFGADWSVAKGLLLSYPLTVEPVTMEDAELAARLWRDGSELSLADRLCLALGARLHAGILTADKAWRTRDSLRQIR